MRAGIAPRHEVMPDRRRPRRLAAGADAPRRFLIEIDRLARSPKPVADIGMSNASTCRMSKPVRAVCSETSVASSVPAPASSTNENAICAVANSPKPAIRAGRDPDAAAREAEPGRRLRRRQPRHVREQHGRRHRQAGAHPQHARVDGHVERADREARRIPRRPWRRTDLRAQRQARRRRRRAPGFRPAACAAARRFPRRGRHAPPARPRDAPNGPGSGWRRSSTRSRTRRPPRRAAPAGLFAPAPQSDRAASSP